MNSIDLHVHSSFSLDGELSPEQIVAQSQRGGLEVISITDHNSVKAVRPAQEVAIDLEIHVISGIEIDCTHGDLHLHVLGYGIDVLNPAFPRIEETALEQERAYVPRLIRRLNDLGFAIDEVEVLRASSTIPTPEFVAEYLLQRPEYMDDERLLAYRSDGSRGDMPYFNFYRDFCAEGKPAYIEKQWPELGSVVNVIRGTGGIPILAHPGASLRNPEKQLPVLLEAGVAGIEAFSSYHSPETTQYYLEKAERYGIGVTCGSDFHGKNKPTIALGSVECNGHSQQIIDFLLQ